MARQKTINFGKVLTGSLEEQEKVVFSQKVPYSVALDFDLTIKEYNELETGSKLVKSKVLENLLREFTENLQREITKKKGD